MSPRSMRTDAFSSVSRILEAARGVFAAEGSTGTLEKIAHEAGVGIATLYRHFPNRQTLARAVYERVFAAEVEPLLTRLDGTSAPREILLDVTERIADILHRERGLVASIGNLAEVTAHLLARHAESFTQLVARAQKAGNLRSDVAADDVPDLVAMFAAGTAVLDADAGTRRRYLGVLLDGLNPARVLPGAAVTRRPDPAA